MSGASRDEKIVALEGQFGFLGYARYFKLLETITEQMDESDKCEVTWRPWKWCQALGYSRRDHALSFLQALVQHGLCCLNADGELWSISIPKLLEIRARKKPIGSKTRRTEVEVEVEVDKDIHTYVKPVKPAKAGAPSEPSFVSKIQKYFLEKWEEKYQMKYQAFSWAQTGALLKRLEKDFSAAPGKLNDAIDKFMHSDDVFILESRHNFGVFYKTINRWLTEKAVAETPMQKVFREMKEERERKKNDVR